IFSIVALTALKNGYYDKAGRFIIFALTIIAFAIVIVMFVKWVDSIARLGRLGTIITKVERATAVSLQRRRKSPTLRGIPAGPHHDDGQSIYGSSIGYVQHVNVTALQTFAEKSQVRITVAALPGTFSAPGRALAYVTADSGDLSGIETTQIEESFVIGDNRKFDEDPRFGLIVLSEIASRALSPAVNDPGTAIQVIGAFVRLFALWSEPIKEDGKKNSECNRVEVPQLSLRDMFDDAFTAIARDGAGMIEVAGRLQKSLESLTLTGDAKMRTVAIHHSRLALDRAEKALELSEDLEVVRKLAKFANQVQQNDSAR
ncbi:MAG: DUF2254 family protein, partial [Desulfobacterales bacterium]